VHAAGGVAIEVDVRLGLAAGRQRQRGAVAARRRGQASERLRADADLIAPRNPHAGRRHPAQGVERPQHGVEHADRLRLLVHRGVEVKRRARRGHDLAIRRAHHDVPAIDPRPVQRGEMRQHRPAGDRMEDLRQRGSEARAGPGGRQHEHPRARTGHAGAGGVSPLRAHSTPPGRLPTTPRAMNRTESAKAAGAATPAELKKSQNAAWLVPRPFTVTGRSMTSRMSGMKAK
jgi:hypothetical protein